MRRVALLIAASVLVFAACSSDPEPASSPPQEDASAPTPPAPDAAPPDPGYGIRSGTRLRLSALAAPGGAYVDVRARDEKYGECELRPTTDDKIRCIPHKLEQVVFKDAQCTQPIVLGNAACISPFAILAETTPPQDDLCRTLLPPRARVFRVLESIDPPAKLYGTTAQGCEEIPAAALGAATTHAAAPAALDELVSVEVRSVTVGRLSVKMLVSEDGMRWPRALVDAASGGLCSFARAGDGDVPAVDEAGSLLCVPGLPGEFDTRSGARYADDTCSTRAAIVVDTCGLKPSMARVYETTADVCAARTSKLHALGDKIDSAYLKVLGQCEESPQAPGNYSIMSIGAPADLSPLPVVTRTLVGDRLKAYAYAVGTETIMQEAYARVGFVDGKRPCIPFKFLDGTYCVPDTASGFSVLQASNRYYADAACTKPAIAVSPCITPSSAIQEELPNACTFTPVRLASRVFSVGAKLATVYSKGPGGNLACEDLPPDDLVNYYAVGDEVPPASVFGRLDRKDL